MQLQSGWCIFKFQFCIRFKRRGSWRAGRVRCEGDQVLSAGGFITALKKHTRCGCETDGAAKWSDKAGLQALQDQ